MKLRNRFFIIFLFISIAPILLIASVAYHQYYSATYTQMDEYSRNISEKAAEQLDNSIQNITQAANMFTFYSSNNSLVQILRPYADSSTEHSPLTIYRSKQDMKYVCQNILNTYNNIYGLYVFTPSGIVLDFENTLYSNLQYQYNPESTKWYEDTLALKGRLYMSTQAVHGDIFTNENETIFFAKYLYDVYSHKFLGVLVINCKPDIINLDAINTLPDITTFTLENAFTKDTIFTTRGILPKKEAVDSKYQKTLTHSLIHPDLTLSVTIDYHQLFQEFNLTGVALITISLLCIGLSVFLSYLLSRSVTKPISELSEAMSSQDGTTLSASPRYSSRSDEIGILYNEYNAMIQKLDESIKTNYQNKLISLDAQMRSLEARINSHFLFNTLASFNSIAEIDESERLSIMSVALGNMFRYAIKTTSEMVTIQEELDHVNDYITIQSIRYNYKFSLDISVPQEMHSLKILKLVLQPLVENAFSHGLKNCQVGDRIEIKGFIKNDLIFLSVSDNGQGMEAAQIMQLEEMLLEEAEFKELGHRNNQSIGLKNIHTRIELYYGKGFGLQIQSALNLGTTVSIKVPLPGEA